MALTLLEASKRRSGEVLRSTVIELFARESDILRVLPFENIQGNALRYNQESALPGIAFRGVNEGYTESTGVLNPVVEPLTIAGGDIDVDNFIISTMGTDQRAVQESMKIKALAQQWHLKFIKGDSLSSPKEFDGLQSRLVGSQLLTQSAGALSLGSLDELIDKVDNPTHLIMNKALRRKFTKAVRQTVSGTGANITFGTDDFGKTVTKYNDLPILVADDSSIASTYAALDFGEPSSTTSVYCVSFGPGMLVGLQNGDMDVRDLREQDAKPVLRTRIEWYSGLALLHPRAAARYSNITNVDLAA